MTLFRPAPKPGKPIRGSIDARRYMDLVAQLPCVCCGIWPVELHHPIMGRFSLRKSSDLDVIPMCFDCHRGRFGLHSQRRAWIERHGLDTDFIPKTRDAVARLIERTI